MPLPAVAAPPKLSVPQSSQNLTPGQVACTNCGTAVLAGASFCGSCGFDLRAATSAAIKAESPSMEMAMPDDFPLPSHPDLSPITAAPDLGAEMPETKSDPNPEPDLEPVIESLAEMSIPPEPSHVPSSSRTQLQQISAYLIHVQTDNKIEIPSNLLIVHIGKPNNLIPPDLDLSGFPDSDIVSRVHGDIRNEADAFYFEDTGSSNGTYINNVPLPPGNRHRLRAGDRIALGKGDKVSFIFQLSS
jgi:pSer/pThr/pTyr-binding forkhead associated (FHA) protein